MTHTAAPTFLQFTLDQSHLIWRGDHLRKSEAKAHKFDAFADFSTRPISDFKPRDIHAFFDHLNKQGLSDNTVNHYAAMLTKVFGHAVKEEVITHAPKFTWRQIEQVPRPLYFTQDQLEAIEAYFRESTDDKWLEHFVIIGHQTGMRLGEICQITPDKIVTDDDGHTWIYLAKTKNGHDRWVPVNKRTRAALRALDDNCTGYFEHTKFYRAWGRMRRDVLKGDTRYVFHTLRHTAATVMANDLKANTAVIGILLGHRSEKTTRKYIKAKPSALQQLAAQMAG
jgi:integrase